MLTTSCRVLRTTTCFDRNGVCWQICMDLQTIQDIQGRAAFNGFFRNAAQVISLKDTWERAVSLPFPKLLTVGLRVPLLWPCVCSCGAVCMLAVAAFGRLRCGYVLPCLGVACISMCCLPLSWLVSCLACAAGVLWLGPLGVALLLMRCMLGCCPGGGPGHLIGSGRMTWLVIHLTWLLRASLVPVNILSGMPGGFGACNVTCLRRVGMLIWIFLMSMGTFTGLTGRLPGSLPHRALRLGRSAPVLAFRPRRLGVVLTAWLRLAFGLVARNMARLITSLGLARVAPVLLKYRPSLASSYRLVLGGLCLTLGLTWWLFNLGLCMSKWRFGCMLIPIDCWLFMPSLSGLPLVPVLLALWSAVPSFVLGCGCCICASFGLAGAFCLVFPLVGVGWGFGLLLGPLLPWCVCVGCCCCCRGCPSPGAVYLGAVHMTKFTLPR